MIHRLPISRLLAIAIVVAFLSASCSPKYPTAPDPVIAGLQIFYGRAMSYALPGETPFFRAYAIRSDGAYIDVTGTATWFSSDSQIMRPLPNFGVFTAVSPGRVDIGARYQSMSGSVTVPVLAPDQYPRFWVGGGEPYKVGVKSDISLSIALSASNVQSITSPLTWISADPSIVSVDGSTVTGRRVGTTVLTTTYNGIAVYRYTSVHPSM